MSKVKIFLLVVVLFFISLSFYEIKNNKEYTANQRNFTTDEKTMLYCDLYDHQGNAFYAQKCDYEFFIYSLMSISFDDNDYHVTSLENNRISIVFKEHLLKYNSDKQYYLYNSSPIIPVQICYDYKGLFKIPDFLKIYKGKLKTTTSEQKKINLSLKRFLYNYTCDEGYIYNYRIQIKMSKDNKIIEMNLEMINKNYFIV